jgi:multidrug efflux pump subunit AcrB
MILVFLGSGRATAAVLLSIPLSAMTAFVVLYLMGSTINTMILGGMALAFSRVIDNSVISLENIYRHLEKGASAVVAAADGGSEVNLAVLAATLVDVVDFFPVTFLYGVSKFLFTALALAFSLSLLASYVVAMTVIPLFCSRFLKQVHHAEGPGAKPADAQPESNATPSQAAGETGGHEKSWWDRFNAGFNRHFGRLLDYYENWVRRALLRPGWTVAVITAIFLASFGVYPILGIAFFPRTDAGQFTINMKAPTGTRIEDTDRYTAKVESLIRRVVAPADMRMIVSNIGVVDDFSSLYTTNAGEYTATVQVQLTDEHKASSFVYMDRVKAALAQQLPEIRPFIQSGSMVDAILNTGMPAPIDVQVVSSNLKQNYSIAQDLAARIRQLPGVGNVYIPQDMDYPAVRLDVDRVHAGELGLTQKDVVDNVITALNSNYQIAPNYWVDRRSGNDYYLTVQYFEHGHPAIHSLSDLGLIPLRADPSGGGSTDTPLYHAAIPKPGPTPLAYPVRPVTVLDNVVKVHFDQSPTEVDHYQIQKVVDVYVTPSGEDLGRLTHAINKILDQAHYPEQVRVDLRGMVTGMMESFKSFGLGFIMSFILLYLILTAQFKSFRDPFLIMLAIPMGFVGVLLTLPLTHTTLNVMSLMGVLMLIGIADSNSILIVDFAHTLEAQGLSPRDAVVAACRVRLRPILMTSLATILGMLPLALKLGTGAEQYTPMARAIIGGLISSVILTIFIVPAAYVLAYEKKEQPGNEAPVGPHS